MAECQGKVPDELREKIQHEKSMETLKEWVRIGASSNTVSEFADRAVEMVAEATAAARKNQYQG